MRKKMPKVPKIVATVCTAINITPGIFNMKAYQSVSDNKIAYLALFF